MAIPALRYLRGDSNIQIVLIYAPDMGVPAGPDILCAVFPIEVKARYHGAPIKVLSLWNHMYCLYPAPLLRANCESACIRALFAWAARTWPPNTLVEFPELRTDGAFFRLLSDVLRQDHRSYHVLDLYTRALFRPGVDADDYLQRIGSAHHRKELRRHERRLGELGKLEYEEFTAEMDPSAWVAQFAALELKGWKGQAGTAFQRNPDHLAYLDAVCAAAAERRRLMGLAMRLDGRSVALKLNFVLPPGSYAFKIAFDEAHAKYSPGTLLELENIRRLHTRKDVRWMDSLAVPDHPMINGLWHDRTTIASIVVAPRRVLAETLLAFLPLLRLVKHRLRRGNPPAKPNAHPSSPTTQH